METAKNFKSVTQADALKQELINSTNRFLKEINRICEDGRVKSITSLESELKLRPGKLSEMERSRVVLDVFTLHLAKKNYNIDVDYVLHGIPNPELAGPIRKGKKLNIYPPFNRQERNRRSAKVK